MNRDAFEALASVEEFKKVVEVSAALLLASEMSHYGYLSARCEDTFLLH
jgi:hypothetical protein